MVRAAVPVFLRVTVWAGLVEPVLAVKVNVEGESAPIPVDRLWVDIIQQLPTPVERLPPTPAEASTSAPAAASPSASSKPIT
jgi:hypothetical protein